MANRKTLYRVIFASQGRIYEIYARQVNTSGLLGFVEIEDLIFNNKTEMVVDPSEERLKAEFAGVKSTHIPMHAIARIDQVDKQGKAKITEIKKGSEGNISLFPSNIFSPKSD